MNIDDMKESKYLRKEDFPTPALATIRDLKYLNVAPDNKPPQKKWVMYFEEHDKGLVCGTTNRQLAANALGSKETEDWMGQQIVIYNDPNVTFGAEVTGGLRLRAVKRKAAPAAAPIVPTVYKKAAPAQTPDPREGVPFADMEDDSPPF